MCLLRVSSCLPPDLEIFFLCRVARVFPKFFVRFAVRTGQNTFCINPGLKADGSRIQWSLDQMQVRSLPGSVSRRSSRAQGFAGSGDNLSASTSEFHRITARRASSGGDSKIGIERYETSRHEASISTESHQHLELEPTNLHVEPPRAAAISSEFCSLRAHAGRFHLDAKTFIKRINEDCPAIKNGNESSGLPWRNLSDCFQFQVRRGAGT